MSGVGGFWQFDRRGYWDNGPFDRDEWERVLRAEPSYAAQNMRELVGWAAAYSPNPNMRN